MITCLYLPNDSAVFFTQFHWRHVYRFTLQAKLTLDRGPWTPRTEDFSEATTKIYWWMINNQWILVILMIIMINDISIILIVTCYHYGFRKYCCYQLVSNGVPKTSPIFRYANLWLPYLSVYPWGGATHQMCSQVPISIDGYWWHPPRYWRSSNAPPPCCFMTP